jgi:DNA repair exonuclease SbcCD ATPase subunit
VKIIRFTAENIKKLKAVEIVPDGSVVQITGPNGSGKSSVLDAIWYALGGTEGVPSNPIRTGTQKAKVTLDLGEITVLRKFTSSGTTLVVEGSNGAVFKSPQKMLDDLMGALTFDPLAFSRMDAKSQLETLRGMVKLDVDIDALDAENAEDYSHRTELNRTVKGFEAQMQAITVSAGTPDKPIDISALLQEMEKAGEHNAVVERQKTEAESRKSKAEDLRSRIAKLQRDITLLTREAKELEETNPFDVMDPIDTATVRQKIEDARATNVQVELKAKRLFLDDERRKGQGRIDEITLRRQDRLDARQKAISKAAMPVPGLSFGEGEILFNDLPFNQASDAEQLRISVAIAMASNPKLRVLRIRDGSLLDKNSLAQVAAMADLNDYQVWIERVDTSGKVGIVMEDGQVAAHQEQSSLDEL